VKLNLQWIYWLGTILLFLIVVYFIYLLHPIWLPIVHIVLKVSLPFILGGFITYLLHPFVEHLHEKGLSRVLAIFIIYVSFFTITGLAIYKGIPLVIRQVQDFSQNIPMFADQYSHWLQMIEQKTEGWPVRLQEELDERIHQLERRSAQLLDQMGDGMGYVTKLIFLLGLIPFISFYLLKDIEKVKKMCWYLTPKSWRKQSLQFIRDVEESLGGYIRGQFIVGTIIGTLASIAFWLIKIKYPLLLGIFVGITNIIPYFGPIIGAIPAVIIGATISFRTVLFVIVIIAVLQFIEGNILSPYIVGKNLHMHPLLIMAALLVGGEIGGIIGLIIAVPILAILKTAIIQGKNHFIIRR
jgi:predicted PurR-regulated permease PerM